MTLSRWALSLPISQPSCEPHLLSVSSRGIAAVFCPGVRSVVWQDIQDEGQFSKLMWLFDLMEELLAISRYYIL